MQAKQTMASNAARVIRARVVELRADSDHSDERWGHEVALRVLDLSVLRGTLPRLGLARRVVVPHRHYSTPVDASYLSNGPIMVECEPGCESASVALDLVNTAQKATGIATTETYSRPICSLISGFSKRTSRSWVEQDTDGGSSVRET